MEKRKIIVLTPIKNEAWILQRFLKVTTQFADHIIIADQASTDESLSICQGYEKVTLIRNESADYAEDQRQFLLIAAARRLFPDCIRILFTLDADEIIAADAIESKSWELIKNSSLGTAFYFEKPDLIENTINCVRWPKSYFPLAFIDDNAPHEKAKKVHSIRFPIGDLNPKIQIHDIKFMHYALLRERVQASKLRFYSVQENVLKTRNFLARRLWYIAPYVVRDFAPNENIEATPSSWFDMYKGKIEDIRSIEDIEYSWHDFEVLKMFNRYGTRRFYLDNIWHFDWEECRQEAQIRKISSIPLEPIQRPPSIYVALGRILDKLYPILLRLKGQMKRKLKNLK